MSFKVAIAVGLCLLIALLGLDVWLAVDVHKGNTWSEILRMWSKNTTIVPWVAGVLGGHLFHFREDGNPAILGNIVALIMISAFVAGVGTYLLQKGVTIPSFPVFLCGIVAGMAFWAV